MFVTKEAENLTPEALLKQLVADLTDGDLEPSANGSGRPEVVATIVVDGVRYSLTRTQTELNRGRIQLSPREREVIRLVAKGLPNKAIAAVLGISVWTVSTYLRRSFTKLGVCSRAELVAKVVRTGLLHQK